jgi:hypothetical protein
MSGGRLQTPTKKQSLEFPDRQQIKLTHRYRKWSEMHLNWLDNQLKPLIP